MPRGWPPLTCREICDILQALGFEHDRDESSHKIWIHRERHLIVPVDMHWDPASGPLISHLVKTQVRVTREVFYGATKRSAKKLR